jgi:hypothetical protein
MGWRVLPALAIGSALRIGMDTSPAPRPRHQKKDVEKALRYAEQRGWTITVVHSGHLWGTAACGRGCEMSIHSTPENQGNHAKRLRRKVDQCPHDDRARRR